MIDTSIPTITGGAARSESELVFYVSALAECPSCKDQGLVTFQVVPSTAPGEGAVARTNCAMCRALVYVTFSAGPGWNDPPTDDLHMATGDAPSTLLPESVLRPGVEAASRRVAGSAGGNPVKLRNAAGLGIRHLNEIRKLRRSEGRDLDPADRELLRTFGKTLVANGGELSPDLAWIVEP